MTLVCCPRSKIRLVVGRRAYPGVLTLLMVRSPSQCSGTSHAPLDSPLRGSLIAPGRGAATSRQAPDSPL